MMISRRTVLHALGFAAVGAPLSLSAQGRCMLTFGTPACNTADIHAAFEPTGWKTTALDHVTFRVADYRKEAAFYIALMGWKLRSDDGKQAVLDIGDWGSARFQQATDEPTTVVTNYCFVIHPWNSKHVEEELRKRGLTPVAGHGPNGFESFHMQDPDGW